MKNLLATLSLLPFGSLLFCQLSAFEIKPIPQMEATIASAWDINNNEVVTGFMSCATGENIAFIYNIQTEVFENLNAAMPKKYSTSEAYRINQRGDIVGILGIGPENSDGDHAFLMEVNDALIDDLGTSPIKVNGELYQSLTSANHSINDRGEACGYQFCLSDEKSFTRPMFYSEKTGIIDLGTPQNTSGSGFALDINNSSIVVGAVQTNDSLLHATAWKLIKNKEGRKEVEGIYLLKDGVLQNAYSSIARAINEKDLIIGSYQQNSASFMRPFIWSKKKGALDLDPENLILLNAHDCFATAINTSGIVVGTYRDASNQNRGFIWKETVGCADLGLSDVVEVTAINDQGVVLAILPTGSVAIYTNNLLPQLHDSKA